MTLIFLGLLGGLFHLAGSQVRSFEQHAGLEIRSKLQGGGAVVTVRADVGPEALWGDVHQVTIQASHFTTEGLPFYTDSKRSHRGLLRDLKLNLADFDMGGLRIERLTSDIPDCRFDFPLAVNHREIRLSHSGEGSGEVIILEKDLERFILTKFHEIKRVAVKIDSDKVFVDGYGEFLFFHTNFSVVARLESPDGDRLMLTYAHILLDGQVANEDQKRVLLDTLNPVVDLDKDLGLHGAIYVQEISLRHEILKAKGKTKIPELPERG